MKLYLNFDIQKDKMNLEQMFLTYRVIILLWPLLLSSKILILRKTLNWGPSLLFHGIKNTIFQIMMAANFNIP